MASRGRLDGFRYQDALFPLFQVGSLRIVFCNYSA